MPSHLSDATEFTHYYQTFKQSIFNYIFYRVSFDRDTAEDLTSEIFLKAFEHLDSYDRNRPFKAWIFAIAHNHLINYFSGKKTVLPLDEALEHAKDESVQSGVENRMEVEKLLALVAELPEPQRDLVIMRYVNDLSHHEIAQITGKAEGAVRTALSRAVASLRDAYQSRFHSAPQ